MIPDFWLYFNLGLKHIISFEGYDHVLFLIALAVPYSFSDWKKLVILISFFTLGHSISLLLSVFKILSFQSNYIELIIPFTILITSLYNLFTSGKKNKKDSISLIAVITVFFGIVHGLGFSYYFKSILPGNTMNKLLPTFEFSLGIEVAQCLIVLIVLLVSYIVQTVFKFSKRDWTLILSSLIIGFCIPVLYSRL